MTCSVMTLSMFIRILYNYLRSQDMEECRELYEEMLQTTREEGWETVELTSRETRLLGTEYVRTPGAWAEGGRLYAHGQLG